MIGSEWSVHELAHCTQCQWESEARNAKDLARRHNERTGHTTRGERGLAFQFATTALPKEEGE